MDKISNKGRRSDQACKEGDVYVFKLVEEQMEGRQLLYIEFPEKSNIP